MTAEQITAFLKPETNDVQELKRLLLDRSEELLLLKEFIKLKGLDAEYQAKITLAKARYLAESKEAIQDN